MKTWLFASLVVFSATSQAAARVEMTDRLIIRMSPKAQIAAVNRQAQVQQTLKAGQAAGVVVTHWRRMSLQAEVVKLNAPIPVAAARKLAAQISQQPGVDWAVASQRRYPAAVPNDPEFTNVYNVGDPLVDQSTVDDFGLIKHLWYLYDVQTSGDLKTLAMSVNWMPAWERSAGFTDRSYASTVAVIDTGILSHGDINSAHVLPGYDFIHDAPSARDGNGRDNDATDAGDWSSNSECDVSDSSWHGTFVAGIVGATANNSTGIAGVNPQANILPIRTLGKCGGWDDDIIDGALWSAGIQVDTLPLNPNPAKVVNFSLGGESACDSLYQSMVNQLRAAGVVVVAAAGNSRLNVAGFSPANCSGVIAVASNARSGALADYSNFGAGVTISAPGGGTTFKVTSTSNAGTTTATTDSIAQERGTSFSTPLVSAGVSLIRAVHPGLTPDEVANVLQLSATPFPAGVDCDVRICGTGVLNVDNAINLAASNLVSNTALLQFTAPVGGSSATQTITLTNKGATSVALGTPVLQSQTAAAADYSLQNNCTNSLAASASCTVVVGFSPASAGGRYAWLEIPAASNATARVALFGVAGGKVLTADSTTALQFSGQVGQTSAAQTISFTNTSQQPVGFSSVSLTPSGFVVASLDCDGLVVTAIADCHLSPNGKLTVGVAFAPTSEGVVNATLLVLPVEGSADSLAVNGTATAASAGGGGGCTVKPGQQDWAWLLIACGVIWLRRRRPA